MAPSSCNPETTPGIAFVLGTRPEMIKLAPVARLLPGQARLFHTGQHFDANLSGNVWESMGLPAPEAVFDVGGKSRATQIGSATAALAEAFEQHRPRAVVVHGDTNATVAGALAANSLGIPLVHIEAGLRSRDRAMPEEHNRVMVDHISDVLFAPTEVNRDNLLAEGIAAERVIVTGNTVVEAVIEQLPSVQEQHEIVAAYGATPNRFVLATLHRPENTDDTVNLQSVVEDLAGIDSPVLFPVHPRTRAKLHATGLIHHLGGVRLLDPLSPREFLALAATSALLISDSGGLQEECSVLKRPLIVVRRSTERPEVIGTFAVQVPAGSGIGARANEWLARIDDIHASLAEVASPYGDGTASALIADHLATI